MNGLFRVLSINTNINYKMRLMKTKQILLASRPKGFPETSNFTFEEIDLPVLQNGDILLKSLYISVDPYMRGRMSDRKSYIDPFEVDKPITGGVVAEVMDSKDSTFCKGDQVVGMLPWATYSIAKGKALQKIDTTDVPASYYLGILGMPGLTAYIGLVDICSPKPRETVVVSGAAGAVGTVVGQMAKILGCYVVGITGSDEKAQLLTSKFGYDRAINYKATDNLAQSIKDVCPKGVDCYFDNVGGDITDAVVLNINFHARIALCGQIALYNEENISVGWRLLPRILSQSALIKGYIVSNYQERFPGALQQLKRWLEDGKLKYAETIIVGFDRLPNAFLGLFTGENTGKMIVKIA